MPFSSEEIMNFNHIHTIARILHKTPCPGDDEIYKLNRPLCRYQALLYIFYIYILIYNICPGVEKKTFKGIRQF